MTSKQSKKCEYDIKKTSKITNVLKLMKIKMFF